MRIMNWQADAGVTWASEVRFQESIGNPIQASSYPQIKTSQQPMPVGSWLMHLTRM